MPSKHGHAPMRRFKSWSSDPRTVAHSRTSCAPFHILPCHVSNMTSALPISSNPVWHPTRPDLFTWIQDLVFLHSKFKKKISSHLITLPLINHSKRVFRICPLQKSSSSSHFFLSTLTTRISSEVGSRSLQIWIQNIKNNNNNNNNNK